MKQFITVNGIEIEIIIEGKEKYIPVKQICKAIGVNYTTQLDKIEKDDILRPVVPLRGTTGFDGKVYKMKVISFRYVFGWIFTINPKNVNEDVRANIVKYKMQCYNALYDYFTRRSAILKRRDALYTEKHEINEELAEENNKYKRLKEIISEIKKCTKTLNSMDKDVDSNQTDLFE